MVEIVKLCKFGFPSWGFRITGGLDYGCAPTVTKVVKGSVAENGGVQVGDIFLSINSKSIARMTHKQIHELILNCADNIILEVARFTPSKDISTNTEKKNASEQQDSEIQAVQEGELPPQETEPSEPQIQDASEKGENDSGKDELSIKHIPSVEELGIVPLSDEELFQLMKPVPLELPFEEICLPPVAKSPLPFKPYIDVQEEQVLTEEEVCVHLEVKNQAVTNDISTQNEIIIKNEQPATENIPTNKNENSDGQPQHYEQSEEVAKVSNSSEIKETTEDRKIEDSADKIDLVENEAAKVLENHTDQELCLSEIKNVTESNVENVETENNETVQACEVQNTICNSDPQNIRDSTAIDTKELTEDDIADIMSGTAEVVTGTTIGVNFLKVSEEVLKLIEESQVMEAIKKETTADEEKKVTTFLQTPKRPKLKPKPKPVPPKPPTPVTEPESETKYENEGNSETNMCESDAVIEEIHQQDNENNVMEENDNTYKSDQQAEATHEDIEMKEQIMIESSVDEEQLKMELLNIQNQLKSIIQLPAKLQKQLNNIQAQLSTILHIPLQEEEIEEEDCIEINECNNEADSSNNVDNEDFDEENNGEREMVQSDEMNADNREDTEEDSDNHQNEDVEPNNENGDIVNEDNSQNDCEISGEQNCVENGLEEEKLEEEQTLALKKDIKWQKEPPKKNRPFFPLTPKPRPIILPGHNLAEKIAKKYDEDFIAETQSGNAEIITGTTLGVNFQKFRRNYDFLQSSKVYRVVHEMDKSQENFPHRSGKIAALEDYMIAAQI